MPTKIVSAGLSRASRHTLRPPGLALASDGSMSLLNLFLAWRQHVGVPWTTWSARSARTALTELVLANSCSSQTVPATPRSRLAAGGTWRRRPLHPNRWHRRRHCGPSGPTSELPEVISVDDFYRRHRWRLNGRCVSCSSPVAVKEEPEACTHPDANKEGSTKWRRRRMNTRRRPRRHMKEWVKEEPLRSFSRDDAPAAHLDGMSLP